MEWGLYLLVIAAGLAAGFINTLSGSGSLITLPVLIFCGLDANVANGTNRIAILLQTAVGVGSFHKQKMLDLKGGFRFSLPTIAGSVIGAFIAVDIDKETMERVIGVFMLIMLILMLLNPKKMLRKGSEHVQKAALPLQYLVYFLIGVYGGFIQAGVGIFLLISLTLLSGYDLVRANALKLFITLAFTIFALAIFIFSLKVNYIYGGFLAAGNMTGAYIATKVAVKKGQKLIHWLLFAVIIASAVKLLFFP